MKDIMKNEIYEINMKVFRDKHYHIYDYLLY
jgi:hypothetical protein